MGSLSGASSKGAGCRESRSSRNCCSIARKFSEGSDQPPRVSQSIVDSVVNRPTAPGSDIREQVPGFEAVTVDKSQVNPGRHYSPPYDDGLTDPDSVFCYTYVTNNLEQSIRVELYSSGREVRHGDQGIASLISILEWQKLKDSCRI